jgi:AcrR family transcriptional regulator
MSSTHATDRRHERGIRTRTALVDVALDLFERQGFDRTTVDQIAATAGVSQRTFFHHFPTKEAVLFSGYADRLAEASSRFRQVPPDAGLAEAIERATTPVAEAIDEHPGLFLRRNRLYAAAPSLRATMLRINEEWIDELTLEVARRLDLHPDDLRARLVATMANGATRAAIDCWVAADGAVDFSRLAVESFSLLRPTVDHIEGTTRG